jgi:hypothetical protein
MNMNVRLLLLLTLTCAAAQAQTVAWTATAGDGTELVLLNKPCGLAKVKVRVFEKYRDTMMAGYDLHKNGDKHELCWTVLDDDDSRIGFLFESGEYNEVEKRILEPRQVRVGN